MVSVQLTICLSVCLSYSPAAAVCGGFAAVGPVGRRYQSIAAQPAAWGHSTHSSANAGNATFLAYIGS